MKYKAITESVKGALGLSDADDVRLLRELNMIRADICAHTDWHFLRRQLTGAYAAGTPVAIEGAVLGVRAVFGSGAKPYYHGLDGLLPRGTGLRFWCWTVPTANQQFARKIALYDENGAPVSDSALSVHYWIAPPEIIESTLATTDIEFMSTAAFIEGMHGRWLRYQELKVEQAGPFEQQYTVELAAMAAKNPAGAIPPTFVRGGVVFSSGDRA